MVLLNFADAFGNIAYIVDYWILTHLFETENWFNHNANWTKIAVTTKRNVVLNIGNYGKDLYESGRQTK